MLNVRGRLRQLGSTMSKSFSRVSTGGALADRMSVLSSQKKKLPGEKRTVFVNERPPAELFDSQGRYTVRYAENRIRTTKYTFSTFLPKNLFEQFRRLANFFFLMMVVLNFFPELQLNGTSMFFVVFPVCVIVGITAVKDAFEDFRRLRSDDSINSTICYTISGTQNMNFIGIHRSWYANYVRAYRKFWSRVLRYILSKLPSKKNQGSTMSTSVSTQDIHLERVDSRRSRKPTQSSPERLAKASSGTADSIFASATPPMPKKESEVDGKQPATRQDSDNVLQTPPRTVVRQESDAIPQTPPRTVVRQESDNVPQTPPRMVARQDSDAVPQTPPRISSASPAPIRRTGPQWEETKWKNIRVGDVIKLRNNESIPADIVILSTSEAEGLCYIETKNLDGETNLKIRNGFPETAHLTNPKDIAKFRCRVDAEAPNTNLYNFNGVLHLSTQTEPEKFLLASPAVFTEKTIPITIYQLLLRGCILRNTDWIIGIVVYTGADTRLIMNSGETPSKRSRIEILMNPQVVANFIILLLLCLLIAIMNGVYTSNRLEVNAPFEAGSEAERNIYFESFIIFWTSMLLLQNFVPISLYVTSEMVKLLQAFFIYNDVELYYEPFDVPCIPKSWTIADDLGQIEYLFSDKTGTLTRNVMEFRKCSIGGVVYGGYHELEPEEPAKEPKPLKKKKQKAETALSSALAVPSVESLNTPASSLESMIDFMQKFYENPYLNKDQLTFVDPRFAEDLLAQDSEQHKVIKEFFTHLAICHTVIVEYPDEENDFDIVYKAQSPDEAALVETAKNVGFTFLDRVQDEVSIDVLGEYVKFEILDIIEFTSSRKRMSVIARSPNGSIILYIKGADSVIYERLAPGFDEIKTKTLDHLEAFATEGLRTLCLGYRVLSGEEYAAWSTKYKEASAALTNRERAMEKVAEEIEKDLVLLGATAIEDQLQQGVPECIARLSKAGIKVWVLTGDKMETAINIGFSCNLLSRDMVLVVVKGNSPASTQKQIEEALKKCFELEAHLLLGADPNRQEETIENFDADNTLQLMSPLDPNTTRTYALVIDGTSLKYALEKDCKRLFVELACRCKAVICCRVSPLQKAQVVRLIKREKRTMTLAIGDGANDVSMIQEAHVGVGIQGQEGMQAVMASDYAIGQFRFLNRLLLVHGRWAYFRTAEMTLLMFYKNVTWTTILVWYQFYCGFSSTILVDFFFISLFNLVFTSLPPIVIGAFDQDLSDKLSIEVPQVYKLGIAQEFYGMRLFFLYILDGIYQSVVCFYVGYFICADASISYTGRDVSFDQLGTLVALYALMAANCCIGLETKYWTWISHFVNWGSCLSFFVIVITYSYIFPDASLGGIVPVLLTTAAFWFSIPLALVLCLLPRFVVSFVYAWLFPTDIDIVREIGKYKLSSKTDVEQPSRDTRTADPSVAGSSARENVPSITVDGSSPPEQANLPVVIAEKINAGLDRLITSPLRRSFNSIQRSPAFMFMKTGNTRSNTGFAFSQEPGVARHLTSIASPTAGTLRRRQAGKNLSRISRELLPDGKSGTTEGKDLTDGSFMSPTAQSSLSSPAHAPPFWQNPFSFSFNSTSPKSNTSKKSPIAAISTQPGDLTPPNVPNRDSSLSSPSSATSDESKSPNGKHASENDKS